MLIKRTGTKRLLTTALILTTHVALYHQYALKPHEAEQRRLQEISSGKRAANESASYILIRLALFIDTPLKLHLTNNLGLNESQIRGPLAQAYVDQVEAILAGLRRKSRTYEVHLRLVESRLEESAGEFGGRSNDDDNYGDIDELLSKFCLYQAEERFRSPDGASWDVGLMLTSSDLYSGEEARFWNSRSVSSSTLGISNVGGIEWPDLSCLIVELGTGYEKRQLKDTPESRVYPTRGFASTWIAAHEIAHTLGIHHDGPPFNELCSSDAWIMSASTRMGSMHTKWSECSSKSLDELRILQDFVRPRIANYHHQHQLNSQSGSLPGRVFGAQFQCSMFSSSLRAQSAEVSGGDAICNQGLWCKVGSSEEKEELVDVGPALEGTSCGPDGLVCIQNECQKLRAH